MIGKSDRQTAEFLAWEARGRGFQIWDFPVVPEPLFVPFAGHALLSSEVADDGRKPTILSSFLQRVSERLAPSAPKAEATDEEVEQTPDELSRSNLVELQVHFAGKLGFNVDSYSDFFASLRSCREPVTFEIIATASRMCVQFVLNASDVGHFRRQFEAFLPEAALVPTDGYLANAWGEIGEARAASVVEFGLGKEFVIPFAGARGDPFVGLCAALGDLNLHETALFQVILAQTKKPWADRIMRSVTHSDGRAMFVNAPEILPGAKEKTAQPLFAAVVRLAAKTGDPDRTWRILCETAATLGVYGTTRGNELIPLENDGYAPKEHEADVISRQTRRSGMLLNAHELAGFVHVPSADVRAPKLRQRIRKSKAAPAIVTTTGGVELGTNAHLGTETSVSLRDEQRARHIHVIGASGTGKSTFLFNLIRQDIVRGEGVTVIDPHGDLIERVLGIIPESRIEDVVLLDPSDEEHVVGFNILTAHSDWEKNLLASDLVSVFRRLSTSWGDQLNSVLQNALLAFLNCDRGGTLLDLRRFLLEPAFRSEVLKAVQDSNVVYSWQKAFPQLSGNKSVGSVVTRLDTLLSPKAIRGMVAQRENRLDFGDIMNGGRIFLAKLSQGAIGRDNSHLLGSLIVAKLQSEAMARQNQSEAERRFHWAYLDEFHDFLTPSLAESLSGVRKYRLGLVLGHQEMRQVERDADVASALLSNAFTRVVFRVGDKDARTLEQGFTDFEAKDLQNLGTGEAVCRVERSDFDFNLAVRLPEPRDEREARALRTRIVEASRAKYSRSRVDIEAMLSPPEECVVPPPAAKVEAPKAREAAKPVREPVVEKKPPVASPPTSVAPEPITLPDLGRGGAQHKAIQDRIKEEAERLGWLVVVEKEVLGGSGSIDLVLTRGSVSIACEVTVTTTIDHEIGNVTKCLKAGFSNVALVSGDKEKLTRIRSALNLSFGSERAKLVTCLEPDAFLAFLREFQAKSTKPEAERRSRGGRVVRRALSEISPEEAKMKEAQALRQMAKLMKQKKRSAD